MIQINKTASLSISMKQKWIEKLSFQQLHWSEFLLYEKDLFSKDFSKTSISLPPFFLYSQKGFLTVSNKRKPTKIVKILFIRFTFFNFSHFLQKRNRFSS
ncbi:hypothetical protein LEP1GSC188_2270 [Leptospira weilii serovar Topaz str. LT2116]|uniref:Uncharacterized protein n=1 Tax=Leptospira weilii serovar Topaz str. LT2116 TaxID=1088540 RepID=M3GXK0_9LEPT|nr:hypothetical protein LEP1GSC188_2270 [Leptospira weilii serovar Topaz str. LT2116]